MSVITWTYCCPYCGSEKRFEFENIGFVVDDDHREFPCIDCGREYIIQIDKDSMIVVITAVIGIQIIMN
jgi:uncharacterized protein (DUF983 family)